MNKSKPNPSQFKPNNSKPKFAYLYHQYSIFQRCSSRKSAKFICIKSRKGRKTKKKS